MTQGRSRTATTSALRVVALELEPRRLLAGWDALRATLFVAALSDTRVGEEVALTVGLGRPAVRATVLGRIVLVRRMGRPALPPGVEIEIDADSIPAMRFLCRAARGEPLPYRERPARWVVPFRLLVRRQGVEHECVTQDVSETGCCILWQGPAPEVREELEIRVREALFASTLRAVVCWTSRASVSGGTRLGLRLAARGRAARAWSAIVAEAGRTGVAV